MKRPRRVYRLALAIGIALMLVLGADYPGPYKHEVLPKWMWPRAARAAAPNVGLRFAHSYNKEATDRHRPYRVAAIGCAPWKDGLVSCDVMFARKTTGAFTCAVLALDSDAKVALARIVRCPSSQRTPVA